MGLAKRVIPCLDVDGGRVVKGINFVDIVDAGDPVEAARKYGDAGADELTFLDITASVDNRDTIYHVVERVASEVFIPLTVGGGVRAVSDIRKLLNAGADKVSINTAAVLAVSVLWWRLMPKEYTKTERRHGGKFLLTVVAKKPDLMPLNGL